MTKEQLFVAVGTVYAALKVRSGVSLRSGEQWRSRQVVVKTDEGHTVVTKLLDEDIDHYPVAQDMRVAVYFESFAQARTYKDKSGEDVVTWEQSNIAREVVRLDENNQPIGF